MKKKKQILSLICSLVLVLSVCCTCCYNDVDVYAQDVSGDTLVDFGLTEDDFLNSTDYFASDYYDENSSLNFPSGTYNWSNYFKSYTYPLTDLDYPYDGQCYYGVQTSNPYCSYGLVPIGSFVNNYDGVWELYVPYDSSYGYGLNFNTCRLYDDYSISVTGTDNLWSFYNQNDVVTIDGVDYKYIQTTLGGQKQFYFTNCPIYSIYNLPQKVFDGDITTLEGLHDNNYTGSITPDNSLGDSSNYLYFDNADVTYDIGDLNGGNVSLWGTPNSYILSHESEFTVKYKYNFAFDVAYNVILGYSSKNDNVGSEIYSVPMTDFISNGYAVSNSLADIERSCTYTENGQNTSIRNLVETYYERSVSDDYDPSKVQWYKFTLTTSFWLEDNKGNSSSWYQETYNFLDGTSKTTNNGLTTNNNPVSNGSYKDNLSADDVLNNGNGVSNKDIPSSNNSNGNNSATGGNASATTGNITINNNPTFNNNSNSSSISSGGSDSTFGGFLSTLILLLASGQSSSSDTLSEITDANGWMTVASTSLSAVPISLWTTLLTTFTICVTISVVAVVISLLLKIFL